MIAGEGKGMNPKCMWEIIGICRAPTEDMLAIARLVARTLPAQSLTNLSIIGGDLILPEADWKGMRRTRADFRR